MATIGRKFMIVIAVFISMLQVKCLIENQEDDKSIKIPKEEEIDEDKWALTAGRATPTRRYPCHCSDGECGCCNGALLSSFINYSVRNRACVNMTYIPEDFEFQVKMVLNDIVMYQRRMSGKNPRPLCITMPYFDTMKMCAVFSNVYVIGRNMHLCLNIESKFRENTVYSYSFECVRIGSSGIALLSQEEGGGLGPPKPVIENTTDIEDYDAIVASEGDDIQTGRKLWR